MISIPAHASYKPLKPDLYLSEAEWRSRVGGARAVRTTPFAQPEGARGLVVDCGSKPGRSFAPERADQNANVFSAAVEHVKARQVEGKRVIVAGLVGWIARAPDPCPRRSWPRRRSQCLLAGAGDGALPQGVVAWPSSGSRQGFETDDLVVVSEQDILGDRLLRSRKTARKAQGFPERSQRSQRRRHRRPCRSRHWPFRRPAGDRGGGAPHDCLELHYADGAKLFLPVENLELLSRYGSEDTEVQLDRLGGGGWQKRKARMRKRILEMAAGLIKIAAARQAAGGAEARAARGALRRILRRLSL